MIQDLDINVLINIASQLLGWPKCFFYFWFGLFNGILTLVSYLILNFFFLNDSSDTTTHSHHTKGISASISVVHFDTVYFTHFIQNEPF